ncbi:unnamed protein product [Lactuca virosa]|uniref:Uncharacterized protein n=1 Tax=Lactuca virosa TaxID=75947 RepID=A0AAU9PLZ8_9ASTR|nr:unnamed protein product [Lactuca virosa]
MDPSRIFGSKSNANLPKTHLNSKSKRLCGFGARTRILNDLKLARLPQTSGRRLSRIHFQVSATAASRLNILQTFLHRVLNPQNLASHLFKHHQAE